MCQNGGGYGSAWSLGRRGFLYKYTGGLRETEDLYNAAVFIVQFMLTHEVNANLGHPLLPKSNLTKCADRKTQSYTCHLKGDIPMP